MAKRRGHGEGSIIERRDGRWMGRLTLPTGERKAFYGQTQRDVIRKMDEAKRSIAEGIAIFTSDRITVAQLFERYLGSIKLHVRHKTFQSYQQQANWHILPALGRRKVALLSSDELDRFLSAKFKNGLSERSVGILHAVIRQALNWGMAQRPPLVKLNVAQTVKAPRVPYQEVQPFTPEEARQFLAAVRGHRLGALFVVTLSCGLREGEALALRWPDVDMEKCELRVRHTLQRVNGEWVFLEPKSRKSRRTIPLPTAAITAIKEHRARQATFTERRSADLLAPRPSKTTPPTLGIAIPARTAMIAMTMVISTSVKPLFDLSVPGMPRQPSNANALPCSSCCRSCERPSSA